jgi:hypothetical protein
MGPSSERTRESAPLLSVEWKNGDCAPVVIDVDALDRVTGWDIGIHCGEIMKFSQPSRKFSCAKADRRGYCEL